jgi:GT2 family glycosyltransferase
MNVMLLSVVLVNYNSKSELDLFFPTVFQKVKEELPDAEFIVVDNASADDSIAYLREYFPEVTLHVEPRNVYFGPAANRGIFLAKGELVLLLNPDVAIERFAFQEVYSLFSKNPRLFSLQPYIRDPRDGNEEGLFSIEICRGIIDVKTPRKFFKENSFEIPFVTGGAAFFRRTYFLDLGGFDPLFSPFYWEDVDLGIRAIRSGFENRFLAAPHFSHTHSTIIRRHYDDKRIKVIYERNRLLFFYKNISLLSFPFLSHCLWLLPRLFHSLSGDRYFLEGFRSLWAVRKELWNARQTLRRRGHSLSFSSVIRRFKGYGHE